MSYSGIQTCERSYNKTLERWSKDKEALLCLLENPEDLSSVWSYDGILSYDPECRSEWKIRKTGCCSQCENLRHLGYTGKNILDECGHLISIEERENPFPILRIVDDSGKKIIVADDFSSEIFIGFLLDKYLLSGFICGNKGRLVFSGIRETLIDHPSTGIRELINSIIRLAKSPIALPRPHASCLRKIGLRISLNLEGGAGCDSDKIAIRRDDPAASAYLSSLPIIDLGHLPTLLALRRLGIKAGGARFDMLCFLISLFSYPEFGKHLTDQRVRSYLAPHLHDLKFLDDIANANHPLSFDETAIIAHELM
jgi:hypothetical protein